MFKEALIGMYQLSNDIPFTFITCDIDQFLLYGNTTQGIQYKIFLVFVSLIYLLFTEKIFLHIINKLWIHVLDNDIRKYSENLENISSLFFTFLVHMMFALIKWILKGKYRSFSCLAIVSIIMYNILYSVLKEYSIYVSTYIYGFSSLEIYGHLHYWTARIKSLGITKNVC